MYRGRRSKYAANALGVAKVEVEKGDPFALVITPKIVAELAAYLRKKKCELKR